LTTAATKGPAMRAAAEQTPHWHADGVWRRGVALLGCASVVMPAYNLARVVPRTVSAVSRVMEETGIPRYELVLVDDGSRDGTHLAVLGARVGPRGSLRVIRYERNRGKGFALTVGALHAACPYLAFLDGDGDIDPRQLLYILAPLHLYDAVVTSKWHPQSRTDAAPLRRLLSHGFRSLTWLLTGLRLRDTQTGAKAFRRQPLLQALGRVHARRYSFDAELLTVLHRMGARILEVPSIAPLRLHGRHRPRIVVDMLLELLATAYRQRINPARQPINPRERREATETENSNPQRGRSRQR